MLRSMLYLLFGVCVVLGSDRARAGSFGLQDVSYDEFMKLSPAERDAKFVSLPADNKAAIKRRYAVEWLKQHRAELSESQVRVIEKAIAFITPELYTRPNDNALLKREAELKQELACSLGRERAQEAFRLSQRSVASKDKNSVSQTIDSWFSWFADCIVRVED